MRRRKNVEDLLAWKQRLDDEEKHITNLEEVALHTVEGANAAGSKKKEESQRPKSEAEFSPARTPASERHSEDISRTETMTSAASEATKSASEKLSSKLSERGSTARDSESSIAEDLSMNSSVAEELPSSIRSPPPLAKSR